MFTTLIIVNANASNGKAAKKWDAIRAEVVKLIPGSTYEMISFSQNTLEREINKFIDEKGINCFISAGGDGALNHLINILYRSFGPQLDQITVGGIALGSSNDFIKPIKKIIKKVPVRLGFDNVKLQDLGIVQFSGHNGCSDKRCFLINASIGVTAEANSLFNSNNKIVHFLKGIEVKLAIWYVAIRSIICFKNIPARVRLNGKEVQMSISNMAIIKQEFISGGFRYDPMVSLNDGFLGLNYCYNMNRRELLNTLSDLLKGCFSGKPKRIATKIKGLSIHPRQKISIETDGEVFSGRDIQFSVIPKAVKVLGI